MSRNFMRLLEDRWSEGTFVCVGLDTDYKKIPKCARKGQGDAGIMDTITSFNSAIVEATADLVCAYKPNVAFYEALGMMGVVALNRTIANIRDVAPEVPVILDCKRADIGNTNTGYVTAAFDYHGADAVTVHPYLGQEALQPFLDQKNKGVFVLCRTSNPGAGELQDRFVEVSDAEAKSWGIERGTCMPLYQLLAYLVSRNWNTHGNCGVVAGATYHGELRTVRDIVDNMPILIPGIGAQGGEVEKTISTGKDNRGRGMLINSSRGIIFASDGPDFADAARRETENLSQQISAALA